MIFLQTSDVRDELGNGCLILHTRVVIGLCVQRSVDMKTDRGHELQNK